MSDDTCQEGPNIEATRIARPFFQIGVLQAMLRFPNQFRRLNNCPVDLVVHSQQGRQNLPEEHESAARNGLNGLGYHYWITEDGRIFEVRPMFARGAHSLSHNGWWGICLAGDCRKREPSPQQYLALGKLAQYLAGGAPSFTLHLHRDLDDTDCPGNYFNRAKVPINAPCLWAQKVKAT
jgi:N-acetylmuramoyl-L-alanine amidase